MSKELNAYEAVMLLHPDLEIDLSKPLKKIEDILAKNGGEVTTKDEWGKRKLAYQIKKLDYAIYVYFELNLPAEAIDKIERQLNITNEVLRYLITKPVPKFEKPKEEGEESEDSSEDKEADKKEEAEVTKED